MPNNIFQAQHPSIGAALLTSSNNKKLIEEYLAWKKSYSKSAFRSYKLWIVKFQNFVNKEPEDIKYTDYVAFASQLVGRHSPRGMQYGLSIIHNYLRFFLEQGRLRFPLYLARIPKAAAESHQPVEESDYRTMVATLRSMNPVPLRDLAIIMLLHDTGLRVGELVSLSVEDLEEDQSAVVRTEKTVRDRRVFWNADTENVLQRYLLERVNRGPSEEAALFVAQSNRHARGITGRSVARMLKAVLKRAGIAKKLSPHSFRHAFIHRLAKLGVPDAIIAQLVGHGSPNAIANYTKLSRPEFKEYAHRQLQYTLDENKLLAA
jgi:site-specific recombinase XerD